MDKVQKLAEMLQPAEIKVLRKLVRRRPVSVDSIAGAAKIKPVEAGRAAMYLENKKLIKQIVSKIKLVELDELGKKYAKSGLPEFKFLKLVGKTPKSLTQLRKSLGEDEVKFSLGYWKRKGMVLFDRGKVKSVPIKKPTASDESRLLGKLASGPLEFDKLSEKEKEACKKLGQRKSIIKTAERTEIILELTDLGHRVKIKTKSLPKNRIEHLTQTVIRSKDWKTRSFRRYDVEAKVPRLLAGRKHVYLDFLDGVKRELIAMGFKEEKPGPIVEAAFFNFDSLFVPQDHPARNLKDIYFVKGKANLKAYDDAINRVKATHENGWETGSKGWRYDFSEDETRQLLLPAHDTANSPRTMLSKDFKVPGMYFTIARCYRPDAVDATHLTEFNQMGGFVVGDGLTFRHLLGLLSEFVKKITGTDEVKFVSGYFPFTEPSVECMAKIDGKWVEMAGAGMFRPELCKPLGIDVPVIAWGFGIDRLFMVREGLKDIRYIFSDDLKWLREARV